MLTIKVLGAGCANCKRLEQITLEAAQSLGIDAKIIKVTDHTEIMDFNVLVTPGLVINEQVVSSGRIPSMGEITTFLVDALEAE